ncbi:MAG: hypothetical protein ACI9HK_000001, partial [Pirellulaceae bacterium]
MGIETGTVMGQSWDSHLSFQTAGYLVVVV